MPTPILYSSILYMYRRNLALSWATSFLALGASAASYTLPAALETASTHSPALQKAEAMRDEGKWKGIEGVAVFLPTVNVSGTHFFRKKIPGFGFNF